MRRTFYLITAGLVLGLFVVAADIAWRQLSVTASEPPQATRQTAASTPSNIVMVTATWTPPPPTVQPSPTATATATVFPLFTQTPEPVPTLQPAETTHIIQAGDTLSTIATQYGVSIEQLAAVNQLSLTDFLYIGDELSIPQPDFTPVIGATAVVTNSFAFEFDLPDNAPSGINGIPYSDILQMSPAAVAHVQKIFVRGQTFGRNPRAFAKVGDSTVENDHFLSRFDQPELGYELGDYTYLQRVIDYYAGSFNRDSAAVRIGLHAWTMFDPQWADFGRCEPNEAPIACEIRLHNPAIVLIRIGSNDVGVPAYYEQSLRQIIEYCLVQGVVPVIGTKADRNDGLDNPNNMIMRELTAEYNLPLWDYDRVAETLPGRGLDEDGIHMNVYYQHDYTDPIAYERGHAMHNLTALIVLDLLTQLLPAS